MIRGRLAPSSRPGDTAQAQEARLRKLIDAELAPGSPTVKKMEAELLAKITPVILDRVRTSKLGVTNPARAGRRRQLHNYYYNIIAAPDYFSVSFTRNGKNLDVSFCRKDQSAPLPSDPKYDADAGRLANLAQSMGWYSVSKSYGDRESDFDIIEFREYGTGTRKAQGARDPIKGDSRGYVNMVALFYNFTDKSGISRNRPISARALEVKLNEAARGSGPGGKVRKADTEGGEYGDFNEYMAEVISTREDIRGVRDHRASDVEIGNKDVSDLTRSRRNRGRVFQSFDKEVESLLVFHKGLGPRDWFMDHSGGKEKPREDYKTLMGEIIIKTLGDFMKGFKQL